jgi:hypothetical protein
MEKMSQKTTLEKVLEREGIQEVLAKHKFPCLTCPFAQYEMGKLELGEVCEKYSIDSKELLKDLNNFKKQK